MPEFKIEFYADRTNINPGERVTFHWHVEGVKAIHFYCDGQDWQDHGVTGVESRNECPQHSTTYYLRVTLPDNSVQTRNIPVHVNAPATIEFSVDRTTIAPGECVTLFWCVEDVKAVHLFREGQNWRDQGVTGLGSRQECPTNSTTYHLRVTLPNGSVEMRSIAIQVQQVAAALPTIQTFGVNPSGTLAPGQSVMVSWAVAGEVTRISLLRDTDVLWDGAPANGQIQDTPTRKGLVTYVLVVKGPQGESRAEAGVSVSA
jgi:plastocyanin